MKKLSVFFIMACLIASPALGVENYWTGAAGNGDWMTAANWGNGTTTPVGTLPGATLDRANINLNGSVVNISASSSASAQQLDVGYSTAGGTNTLNIFGSLNVVKNWRVGSQTGGAQVAIMNVDGGTLTNGLLGGSSATDSVPHVGRYGSGTLNITNDGLVKINNSLVTSGTVNGYGVVNLIDGILQANGWRAFEATSVAGIDAVRGTRSRHQMDITGGTLILQGDRLIQMWDFANGGVITGYGEAGYGVGHKLQIRLVEGYLVNGNWGTLTEVTAIPEPATIMLLGIGSLIFVRRKK